MIKLLQRSMEEQLPIEIIYMSANNRFTKRTIIVRNMNSSKVFAYCYLRKQNRLFKISQILSAMPQRNIS